MHPSRSSLMFLVLGGFLTLKSLQPALSADNDASHGKSAAADYETVFNTGKVYSFTIQITPENWKIMQDDMIDLLGKPGTGGGFPGGPAPGGPAPGGPGPGGGDPDSMMSRDPIWVSSTVNFDSDVWSHVGIRFKGNSSLSSLWRQGNRKLPFKLSFAKFDSEEGALKDQRFFGFKSLSFAPNWNDDSQVKEGYVADLLRSKGIPVARWAFARIFVDAGAGPEYWGLYTMLEEVDDGAMLKREFGNKKGNLYKPSGKGADWTVFNIDGFDKKSNEEDADYADVQGAVNALLATGPGDATWRQNLEQLFDVQSFLHWLAINTIIKNWDAYGSMAHNYYLYGDTDQNGRLVWIPWDHNLSMAEGGFGPGGGTTPNTPVDEIFHQKVGANWPLISRLLADPVYKENYRVYVEDGLDGLFTLEAAEGHLQKMHDLIAPYLVGPEGEIAGSTTIKSAEAFENSLSSATGLFSFIGKRQDTVKQALQSGTN